MPAVAEVNITKGCFIRDYDEAHLARHPDQVVDWIRMDISTDDFGETIVYLDVFTAHHGSAPRAGPGGNVLVQTLVLSQHNGQSRFRVDCGRGRRQPLNDAGSSAPL